ncbi:MAG: ABC transporter substrate-binding protein [Candidatus Pacebacteria bacterium]|nr:ABC transporter substrate-binding protein [Candidatus Paceibacterota bacterium]MDD5356788.1 ABC transporter substrate-binding protein [Candidatus Paceibacterota bacterium]
MNKKIIIGIVLVLLVTLGIGIAKYNAGSRNTAALELSGTIKVGAALGLTGECANYGEGELKAARLAIDEANKSGGILGRKLELITEDTQCSPKGSVNAIRKLIDINKAEAIVGLTFGDSFQAGYTINNPAHIVAVSPSTALEALAYNNASTDYVFSTWFSERDEIQALQKRAKEMNIKKFVLFHDEDAFASMLSSLWNTYAKENGLTIVKEYKVPVGYDDYRTIILKMKADNPEGIAFFAQTQATRAKFMKEAKELGLNAQIFQSADIEYPSLLENFGSAMEGIIYTFPEVTGESKSFFDRFKAFYGEDSVGGSDANAYDATRVIIATLTEHYKNGTDMKTAVEKTNIPGTAFKEIKFDEAHQVTGSKYIIKTVRDGKFVEVK